MKPFRRAAVAAVAVIAALSGIVVDANPAGALSQNQAWHGGRAMFDNYGSGAFCTSGPTFYSGFTGNYYKAMPRHCYEPTWNSGWGSLPFDGVYENDFSNYLGIFDPVLFPAGGYSKFDLVLIDLGSTAPAKSKLAFNYCVGSNCSSYYGGGSSNPNWSGGWFTIVGSIANPNQSTPVTKSGARSGTSWTTAPAPTPFHQTDNGYDEWIYQIYGFGQCGAARGDSGAPVFWHQGNSLVYLMGMLVGGTENFIAGPGNGCYPQGTRFGTSIGMISVAQIQAAYPFLSPLNAYF